MAYARIRPRRGSAYEWSTYNPILESGELGLEYPDAGLGTGLCKWKVGNGLNHWNDLEYAFDGTAADSINGGSATVFHVIQLRAATEESWAMTNPIINENEIVYVIDQHSFKVGNGLDNWSELPYIRCGGFINDEIDFGDEDNDEILPNYGAANPLETYIANNEGYPDSVFDWNNNTTVHSEAPEETSNTVGIDSLLNEDYQFDADGGEVNDKLKE